MFRNMRGIKTMQINMDLSYFSGTFALAQLTVLCGHQLSHSAEQ